jgi:hypothetical protein
VLVSLLPNIAGKGMSVHELSDPDPTGVPGGAIGRQDVVRAYGFVGVGDRRVLLEKKRTLVREVLKEPIGVFGLHLYRGIINMTLPQGARMFVYEEVGAQSQHL